MAKIKGVARRDGKVALRNLLLGCGALGSWTAEMIVRAGAASIDVVDSGVVKPGLLARQNFITNDIGNNKAAALAARLRQLVPATVRVEGHASDAHRFVLEDKERFAAYDVVLDCTASHIMQMKLERDWSKFAGNTPPLVAMATDSRSRRGICVCLARNSTGGQWDAFIRLKNQLCSQGFPCDFLNAFYDPAAAKELFQPEPGCSDPTFAGSTADAMGIAGAALNAGAMHTLIGSRSAAIAFTLHRGTKPTMHVLSVDDMDEVQAASYRVRISKRVHTEARGWARQNDRLRTSAHETGGLLWGIWDDAVRVIWAFDASGPPPDSIHDPGHFVCGTEGTREEHEKRLAISRGTSGFIGFWHTHPDMESFQSGLDIRGMAELVSALGQNQKRSLMLIYGRKENQPTAGVYAYESHSLMESGDLVVAGTGQLILPKTVV